MKVLSIVNGDCKPTNRTGGYHLVWTPVKSSNIRKTCPDRCWPPPIVANGLPGFSPSNMGHETDNSRPPYNGGIMVTIAIMYYWIWWVLTGVHGISWVQWIYKCVKLVYTSKLWHSYKGQWCFQPSNIPGGAQHFQINPIKFRKCFWIKDRRRDISCDFLLGGVIWLYLKYWMRFFDTWWLHMIYIYMGLFSLFRNGT